MKVVTENCIEMVEVAGEESSDDYIEVDISEEQDQNVD